MVTNRKDINHLYIEHFKAIFASNNPVWDESLSDLISPCISDEDNEILTRVPMEEEIKKAVFNIDFHKAPALDGYTAFFLNFFWPIILLDVIAAVRNFFLSKKSAQTDQPHQHCPCAKGESLGTGQPISTN